jgi:hypothetical protein
MKNRFVIHIISSILMTLLVIQVLVDSGTAEDKFLKEITLEKKTVNGESLYHYQNDIFLSFDHHIEGSEKDYGSRLYQNDIFLSFDHHIEGSEKDYGSRLTVFRVTNGNSNVIYYSKGSFDSYILRPSFFSTGIGQDPLLILAETGTEYSWGARVFLVSPDGSAKNPGSLGVAVIDDPENDTVSVIPHTRIKFDGKRYEFTFEKDVIFNPGGLNDHPVSRNKIKYVYDGTSLKYIETGK